jgi:short-subunit dehydrogenase
MNDFPKKYGHWAIVTGASSGIGEEFSRQLAAQGLNLVLIARRRERLELLSEELIQEHNIEVKIIPIDIANPDFVEQVQVVTHSLDVGLVVNNAGFALTGNFLDHTLEEELSLLHVNCRAPLMLAHMLGRRMVKRGRGGIINVSSAMAFLPAPLWTHYAASKAYDLYLSEGLWFELREKGVDVLALCPGATRTEFSRVSGTTSTGMEPGPVVELALKNLGKKSTVIPGFSNRIIVLINRIVPRQWLIKIGAKVVRDLIGRG